MKSKRSGLASLSQQPHKFEREKIFDIHRLAGTVKVNDYYQSSVVKRDNRIMNRVDNIKDEA